MPFHNAVLWNLKFLAVCGGKFVWVSSWLKIQSQQIPLNNREKQVSKMIITVTVSLAN